MSNGQGRAYGPSRGISKVPPYPITSPRAPSSTDLGYVPGQDWIDSSTNTIYILAGYRSGIPIWVSTGGSAASIYPITPYVVGPVGFATYQTVQSALTAANAAGGGTVYIQNGSYAENLTLFPGSHLVAVTQTSTGNAVIISGQHTPPATGVATFTGITMQSANNIINSAGPTTAYIAFFNCTFNITGVGNIYNLPASIGSGLLFNCFDISSVFGGLNGVINVGSSFDLIIQTSDVGTAGVGAQWNCGIDIFNSNIPVPFTILGGTCNIANSRMANAITISGGVSELFGCIIPGITIDGGTCSIPESIITSTLTTGGNATVSINNGIMQDIVHGSAGTLTLNATLIDTTTNPAISGAGAGIVRLADVNFINDPNIAPGLTVSVTGVQRNGALLTHGIGIYPGASSTSGTSAAMIAGTITVNTTAVLATSKIYLTTRTLAGVATPQALYSPSNIPGTSFVIQSASAADTSTVDWFIVQEAI